VNAEAIAAVSVAVTTMTQLVKWAGLPKNLAPLVVFVFSILGTALWAYSVGDFSRTTMFGYFAGALTVAMTAVGIYGFTTREAMRQPRRAARQPVDDPEVVVVAQPTAERRRAAQGRDD
jgi:hypothetical protein